MIFYENTYRIGLLNYSYCPLYSDPFDIVEDKGSTVPFRGVSTNSSTFIPQLIGSKNTPTETITSLDRIYEKMTLHKLHVYLGRLSRKLKLLALMLETFLQVDRFTVTSSRLVFL